MDATIAIALLRSCRSETTGVGPQLEDQPAGALPCRERRRQGRSDLEGHWCWDQRPFGAGLHGHRWCGRCRRDSPGDRRRRRFHACASVGCQLGVRVCGKRSAARRSTTPRSPSTASPPQNRDEPTHPSPRKLTAINKHMSEAPTTTPAPSCHNRAPKLSTTYRGRSVRYEPELHTPLADPLGLVWAPVVSSARDLAPMLASDLGYSVGDTGLEPVTSAV